MLLDPEQLKTAAEIAEIGSGLIVGVEFLPTVFKCAQNWISTKFHGHPQEAIDAAQCNFNNFSGQVNICLDGLQQIEGFKEKTEHALADPDYTTLLQEAALGAARTNSVQKHKLLARLVTDRLAAEPDSLRTLAAHMACNAVPQLSPTHLRFLAFMAVVYARVHPQDILGASDEETIKNGLEWFLKELSPLMPIERMSSFDYTHVAAASCITYGHNIDLLHVLEQRFRVKSMSRAWINDYGKELPQVWEEQNVGTAYLTPAGALIGMYVQDAILAEQFKWIF